VAPPVYKGWNNFSLYYRGAQHGTVGCAFNYLVYIAYDGSNATSPYEVASIGDLTNGGALTTVAQGWNDAGGGEQKSSGVDFTGTLPLISCLGTFTVNGSNLIYRNGIQVLSTAWGNSSPAATSATTQIQINGWTFQPRSASPNCYIACAWNRALSAAEAALLDVDPYCFLIPAEGEMPALYLASSGAPSGTLATTEAADAAAFTGGFANLGTLATTEAADTAAFAGNAVYSGTLAATETADTAALSGGFADLGTLAVTEAADVAALSGNTNISGTLAVTEAADVAALSGTGYVSGTLATTEATDASAFAGNVDTAGTLAVTEAADTAALSGGFGLTTGTLAATETPDVAAFAITVPASVTTTIGGTRVPGGRRFSRKEWEKLLEEIHLEEAVASKAKTAVAAVKKAKAATLEVVERGNIEQEAADRLARSYEAARGAARVTEAIARANETVALARIMMDEEDEDDIMLMVWAIG
jgi:hypothetical protein